jgi:hypothetical protein
MVRLRVTSPFLAVQSQEDKNAFCTLTVGSIIATGEDLWQPGLLRISVRGQQLLAFARDIKEHTEAVDLDFAHDNGAEGESERDSLADRQEDKHPLNRGR